MVFYVSIIGTMAFIKNMLKHHHVLKGVFGQMHDNLSRISKSVLVVLATLILSVLLGIIGVSRRYSSIMPASVGISSHAGLVLVIIGLLLSLATSLFILRYFIFFTRVEVVDSVGNPLSDNASISIGGTKVRPIVIASAAVLISMIFIGMGVGVMFNRLMVYIIYLSALSCLFLAIALVIFLFSVIRHKIRRRFAWIASGLLVLLAVFVFCKAIPSIRDVNISEGELTAITGTVSSTSPCTGMLSGPGKTQVVIKGTSGESLALQYSGNTGELHKGSRYTFYYMPNSKLIDKVVEAENIKY